MKAIPAIIFGLLMTVVLGGSVILIGANALLNTDQTPVSNLPVSAPANTTDKQQQQAIQQLVQQQETVNQYQDREKQYQAELKQAADKLIQANQQLDQTNQSLKMYQSLVNRLQQAGVIRITSDGRVLIPQGQITAGSDN